MINNIKYAIATLGCKVNTYESQSINDSLKEMGYIEVDYKENADVYIVFTCAVTNTAASKSRQKINQAKRQNPNAIICVVGCYVQINAEKMKEDEAIDILVGSSGKSLIPALIKDALENKTKKLNVNNVLVNTKFELLPTKEFNHQTRAFLKIQDGCNQFCSYCIIPYARGNERSLDPKLVIEQAQQLSTHHKEIVLSGIHTGRYGRGTDVDLTTLIKRILTEVKDVQRIRISSIEITEITDELIDLIKNNHRVCSHLHIPIQSACNKTLKNMNRPYTVENFIERVNYIRKEIKNISISTDLIVGFAGETIEDFNECIDNLKVINFSFMHVFPYSIKTGTVASKMNDQVIDQDKKERVKICTSLSNDLYFSYMSSFINKELEVLVEKNENGYSIGHSSEYLKVMIDGNFKKNTIVKVTCTHLKDECLFATLRGEIKCC